MNTSMLPLYGVTFLAKRIRKFAEILMDEADHMEARRSLSKEQQSILQKNSFFANKHKGQPAFVIVNGPSLATQNILGLKDEITFVVSAFWKHEAVFEWQPTYYSLLDAAFFKDTQVTKNFYENLHQRINNSTFFLPLFRGFDAVKKYKLLPEEKTYYVASVGTRVPENDLTGIVQGFESVSAFALSQAVYMGCNPIYLLGFDHDYLAHRGIDRHFYADSTLKGHPLANLTLAERRKYDHEMRSTLRLWENYRILDEIAKSKKIKIYNATNGGFLDVFERVDFNKIRELISNKINA